MNTKPVIRSNAMLNTHCRYEFRVLSDVFVIHMPHPTSEGTSLWKNEHGYFRYRLNYFSVGYIFLYLFGVLRRFQHCTGHITTGSWKGRGNQYIEFARVLYCKLPTNGKQLPAFPHKAFTGIEPRPQRWEARVLPLCHRGPYIFL